MDGDDVCSEAQCPAGAVCDLTDAAAGVCVNQNPGGGCGGLQLDRTAVGAFLGIYIILSRKIVGWLRL